MRKLNTSDLFACARVLKVSGMREELKNVVQKYASGDVEEVGILTILAMIETLMGEKKSEEAIYDMLAGIAETEPDNIRNLELPELATFLQNIASENDMKSFFGMLSGILGKK